MRFMKTRASRGMRKIFQGFLALVKLNSRMQLAQSHLLVFQSVNERTKPILSIISLKHLKSLEYDKVPAGAAKCFAIRSALSLFMLGCEGKLYIMSRSCLFKLTCYLAEIIETLIWKPPHRNHYYVFFLLTNHKGWQATSSFAVLVLFALARIERKFSESLPKWCILLVVRFNRVSAGGIRWGSTLPVENLFH